MFCAARIEVFQRVCSGRVWGAASKLAHARSAIARTIRILPDQEQGHLDAFFHTPRSATLLPRQAPQTCRRRRFLVLSTSETVPPKQPSKEDRTLHKVVRARWFFSLLSSSSLSICRSLGSSPCFVFVLFEKLKVEGKAGKGPARWKEKLEKLVTAKTQRTRRRLDKF